MESKEKHLKNTRGITLVSLVVTIIVMIILAGISISLTLGDNRNNNKGYENKGKDGHGRT